MYMRVSRFGGSARTNFNWFTNSFTSCDKFSILLLLILCFFSFQAKAVFDTPGEYSTGPDGGANYTIPLGLPAGTAGMQPSLSLGFNSSGHNGIFGVGWDLDGLSQIARCPKTRANDGVKAGVKYDSTDKFCLDGQPLVAISGTYGADSTEYRTKLINYSKIVSYGVAGNGPSWFKVWTKSGSILEFGNTSESKIEASGKTSIRIWAVNKVSDTKGNYFTATYYKDNPTGEAFVTKIDYTGNSTSTPALSPYANVQFIYENRPDISTEYQGGSVIKSTRRVTNIKVYLNSALVRDYRLSYLNAGGYHVNASNVADGTLLTQIKECDGSATPICLNPTIFSWTPATPVAALFSAPSGYGAANSVSVGDTNGDSMADSLYYAGGPACNTVSGSGNFNLGKSTGASIGAGPLVATQYGVGGGRKMVGGGIQCEMIWPTQLLADLNLDGYDDYIASVNNYTGGNISVRLSQGNAFQAAQNWGGGYLVDVGDFNGDGKADFLYDTSTPTVPGTLFIGFSTGSAIGSSVNTGISGGTFICQSPTGSTCGGYGYVPPDLGVGDFNGDGLSDVVLSSSGQMYFSNGASLDSPKNWLLGVHIVSVGDVNGDGLADILYDTTTTTTFGNLFVALSTGNEFIGVLDTGLKGGGGAGGGGYICATYVSGGTITCPAPYKNVYKRPYATLSDINGDGLADLQYSSGSLYYANALAPDLLTTITGGLGTVTTITYSKLSNESVYIYESGSTYPNRDVPRATLQYVVSSTASSDGIGGFITNNYSYGGAKVDLSGRGSLGFRWMKTSMPDSGLTQTTFYRQDYPFIGLPSQLEKRTISGSLIAATQNSYATTTLGSGVSQYFFPYLLETLEQNFELDGSLISSSRTAHEYDPYGNVTKTTVTTNDGYIKTTLNTYVNNSTNWLLGRLLRSEVTSATP